MRESDSEIVALMEERERAAGELQRNVARFTELVEADAHGSLAAVQRVCAAILTCEAVELTRDEIAHILGPLRHARSWAAHILARAIDEQHRGRVREQAARIVQTLSMNPRRTRIASIACGGCPDLRLVRDELAHLAGEIWLHDEDPAALAYARDALRDIASRCTFREADAGAAARGMPRNAFDLVVAGSLFDTLGSSDASLLLQMLYRVVAEGGVCFFTNVAKGNPYRPLLEYFGEWRLVERSEEDVYRLCESARIGRGNVHVRRDESGAALVVEITKLE